MSKRSKEKTPGADGFATTPKDELPEEKSEPTEGVDSPEEGEPATEGERLERRLVELEEELTRVRDEAEDANNRALRLLAEFSTYRRRNERERASAEERGAGDVLRELLEVVDNFDRALEHVAEGVPSAFLDGMRLVARTLHDVLDRRGIERIEAVGKEFDPELHEALSSMPSEEAEPNTVLSEVQPGYMLGEKVLRAAKVIVASRAES